MNVRAKSCLSAILSCLLMTAPLAAGYELVVDDRGNRGSNLEFSSTNIPCSAGSVLYVAQRIAHKMMEMYPGNKTNGIPGLFGDPYYWWEAGAVFGVGFFRELGSCRSDPIYRPWWITGTTLGTRGTIMS